MNLYTAVGRALLDLDVTCIFGVMGDANMQIIADYIDAGGAYISAVDERGAVAMAVGYAQATRTVGVASVTHGPGVTNCLTALVEGAKARTPLVVLSGDTSSKRPFHSQWIELAELVAPTGAGYRRVRSAHMIGAEVAGAVRAAVQECRPVVLDIPADLLEISVEYQEVRVNAVCRPPQGAGDDALDEALGALMSANRPIIIAGHGAVEADAGPVLEELADEVGATLATTVMGRGVFDGNGRNIGIFGTLASSVAVEAITRSDCVVALGASLHEYTTDRWGAPRRQTSDSVS